MMRRRMSPISSPREPVRASPVHVLTALGVLIAGASIYAAYLTTPELAASFSNYLLPKWVSPGYNRALVAPGKLSQLFILFGVICLAAAAGWHLAGLFLKRPSLGLSERRFKVIVGGGVWVAITALVAYCGNRQFGGCDQSLAVDVGWRLASGQMPYRDFICTLPIGFALAPGWAFQVLGVSWTSLTVLNATFVAVMFLWQAVLLRRLIASPIASLVVAAALQVLAMVVASFWWYNPITNATAMTYLLSALVLLRQSRTYGLPLVSYTLSMVILAAMKPNVAGLLIVGTTAILLTSRKLIVPVLIGSAAGFGLFVTILTLNGVSLLDVLSSYLSIAQRGELSPSRAFYDVNGIEQAIAFAAIALTLSPLLSFRSRDGAAADHSDEPRAQRRRVAALLVLSVVTGAYAILAHGELKFIDLPFLLLAAAIPILGDSKRLTTESRQQWVLTVCVILIAMAVTLGVMRHRVEKIGFGAFFEWSMLESPPNNEFFSSLRTGPRFHAVVDQINEVLAEHPNDRVFFGPRLEAFYAATGRESPRGLPPLLWHRGTFHPESREPEMVEKFKTHDFDVLIFMYWDFTYLPAPFLEEVIRNYRLTYPDSQRFRDLTVLTRREPHSPR